MQSLLVGSIKPTSTDPLEFDALVHHLIFGSVFGTLVTEQRTGGIQPYLAQSWSVSDDGLTWKFLVRQGLRFGNGDEITPRHWVLSLTRLAFLIQERGSEEHFLSFVDGFGSLRSAADNLRGLQAEGAELIIRLHTPQPELLQAVSFGLFGLAHPSLFEASTGQWLDPRESISSGFYEVNEWSGDHISLTRRRDFLADMAHPQPFDAVEATWRHDSLSQIGFTAYEDITLSLRKDEGLSFHSTRMEMSIAYARVHGGQTHPLLKQVEYRRLLRDHFFSKYWHSQPYSKSFLPLSFGVSEFPIVRPLQNLADFKEFPLRIDVQSDNPFRGTEIHLAFEEAMQQLLGPAATTKQISDRGAFHRAWNTRAAPPADVGVWITGCDHENIETTLRFMVLSKEGIKLPDPTGRLAEIVKQPKIDLNAFNQQLWDDAIIWPLGHPSFGFWTRDFVDLSLHNLALPAVNFAFIGRR